MGQKVTAIEALRYKGEVVDLLTKISHALCMRSIQHSILCYLYAHASRHNAPMPIIQRGFKMHLRQSPYYDHIKVAIIVSAAREAVQGPSTERKSI